MGCAMSVEELRNREIEKQLRKHQKQENKIVKLLLLGSGDSGKSTIVKQMKLLHPVCGRSKVGFTDIEMEEARIAILFNIKDCITILMNYVRRRNIVFENELLNQCVIAEIVNNLPSNRFIIEEIWSSKEIQNVFRQHRQELQLDDSTEYFMSAISRVTEVNFEPSNEDILRTRVRTTGIIQIEFEYEKQVFHMFDVGGQRSERKKWMNCFDNVDAILYIIALSEFDQVLYEDRGTNRMKESLTLFQQTSNNSFFTDIPFIVFFNKMDIFEKKIESGKNIREVFPHFEGPDNIESSVLFIVKSFKNVKGSHWPKNTFYSHLTTATDTELVSLVFKNIAEIIINRKLKEVGLE